MISFFFQSFQFFFKFKMINENFDKNENFEKKMKISKQK